MTSPLLRLFAVCWWLLVIGSLAAAYWIISENWDSIGLWWDPGRGSPNLDAFLNPQQVRAIQYSLLLCLLPYVALTVVRWIITARWRFGPRW